MSPPRKPPVAGTKLGGGTSAEPGASRPASRPAGRSISRSTNRAAKPDARPLNQLRELGKLLRQLKEAARQAEQIRAQQRAAQLAAERQRRLFASHVEEQLGGVTPLPPHDLYQHQTERPSPWPRQREADEKAALAEAMSDEVDLETLLLTDDGLSFTRPGLASDVLTRLRRGHWAIQGELDLHGLRRDAARDAVGAFLRQAQIQGWRCLRVVHGKGHGSPGREPVLKAKVQRWLGQHQAVLAFTQATGPQGGAGALLVLLQGQLRSGGRAAAGARQGARRSADAG